MGRKSQLEDSSKEQPAATAGAESVDPQPCWLKRSSVYKRVPSAVRYRLDEAIVWRPKGCENLEAIAKKFQLCERYRISPSALRTYARKLEQFIRPAMTSQVMACLLGCLPAGYRRQLAAGGEVMLLSRVVKLLSDEQSTLPVADLAKLATILSISVRARGKASRLRASHVSRKETQEDSFSKDPVQSTKLAEAVRQLYGLPWPPNESR